MMRHKTISAIALALLWAKAWAGFGVYDLRCEHVGGTPIGVSCHEGRFSWKLMSNGYGVGQQAYQIVVGESVEQPLWNSGRVESHETAETTYGGERLKPETRYCWAVRSWNADGECSGWSRPQAFVTEVADDWHGARWIAMESDGQKIVPAIHVVDVKQRLAADEKPGMYRLPQFRKVVKIRKSVVQATAYVAGLGQFDFFIDGRKVGDHFMDAGWRDYGKEAQYVGFDVTERLSRGSHVIGVVLGNGFYNVPRERYFKLLQSYGAPKMRLCLVVRYDDGTVERTVSDGTWRVAESPITYSSVYGGESYDATREMTGWMSDTRYKDNKWQKAIEVEQDIRLTPQIGTELRVMQELATVRRSRNSRGQWVYDLGQNFSGIVSISVKGRRGQKVRLVPAELLKADGTANQRATGSPYYWEYTLRGDSVEQWQPQFSYYGFRYVQVEGAVAEGEANADSMAVLTSLKGLHTTSGQNEAGTFSCSKPLLNQTFSLIDWAMRSNMASVLTDCPHREKLGWLEQYYLMQTSLMYRYDVQALYEKTIDDMADAQLPNGAIPTIAPEYVRFSDGFEDTPEWGSAFIVCPWQIYKMYGNKRPIERHYAAMKRYMDYLASRADGHIIAYGLGDWFDIGPKKPGKAQLTSNALTATATYYYDATLMARMAALMGRDDDAERYGALANEIKTAYNNRFYSPDKHSYENGSQTANAISLYFGLVDKAEEQAVLGSLVGDIESRGYALTAGDIGYRYVVGTLTKWGRSDVVYSMNSRYDVPGYGWQIAHGATALTESWQAYDNVSNNHFMLGHIMEWLFSGLGGIRQSEESVAFGDIVIDPQVVGDVTSARTAFESVHGRIVSEWRLTDGRYSLRVEIPANTTATIVLPTADTANVAIFGEGVTLKSVANGKSMWSVGSGDYSFEF